MSKSLKNKKSVKSIKRRNVKTRKSLKKIKSVKITNGGFPFAGVIYNLAIIIGAVIKGDKPKINNDGSIVIYQNKEQAIRFTGPNQIGVVGNTAYLNQYLVENALSEDLKMKIKKVQLPAEGGQGGGVPAIIGYALELTPDVEIDIHNLADQIAQDKCYNEDGTCPDPKYV